MDKPETTEPSSQAVTGAPGQNDNGTTETVVVTELCPTNLLTDIPETTDKFEGQPHQKVARAIAELIQAPEPQGITIGLEGSWGAGKTTIIHLLKAALKKERDIKLISFDAWAHEGDPLRWTFLETLIRDLQEDEWVSKEGWDNTLEELANRREVTTIKDTPVLKKLGKAFAVSLLLVPVGGALFSSALRENITLANTGHIAWTFIVESILGLAFSLAPLIVYLFFKDKDKKGIWELIANKGIVEKRTETNKTANPTSIEFGNKFGLLMDEALKQNNKRIVLIVDNLDRVDAKEALSIWSTLQTFLQYRTDSKASWSNRLWLLALYDLKGLSLLWETGDGDQKEGRVIGDVATSFMDKNFQIRFEVPPPVLSDWRSFLMEKLKDAFPRHEDTDFHQAYRVLAIHLDQDRRLPTIRELKLYVNQIGAIHRQWAAGAQRKADAFPLAHIAYYVMLRRKGQDVINELKTSGFPPKEYRELLGDQVQDSLAAIAFNVEVEVAQQLLITTKVKDALSSGSSTTLKDIANLPRGIWELLERIITTEWQDAESVKIAYAAHALSESGLLEKATRPEARTITEAMCRTAAKVEAWVPLDEQKARGLSTLLKWKQSNKRSPDYQDYLTGTLKAISVGLTTPAEDFSVKTWLQSLAIILNDLQADDKIRAYSEIVGSLAEQLRAGYLPESSELEIILEALSEFQLQPDSKPAVDEALSDLTGNGHILSQLSNGQNRTSSAVAWCLYVLLGEAQAVGKPSPIVGRSAGGYDYLTKMLTEPSQPVVEKFTEILARYKKLSRLFDLNNAELASRHLAVASLKDALPKEEFRSVFDVENFVERLSYIKDKIVDSDSGHQSYEDLIKELLKGSTFIERLVRSNFDLRFGKVYEDMVSNGAGKDRRFQEWSSAGIQSINENEWLGQLDDEGAAPKLARMLKQDGANIALGKEFLEAVVSWVNSFGAQGAGVKYRLGFSILPLELLSETDRKELRHRLLGIAL
ncbi:MAG TPA: P-loop NTPase fold protein, partial [Pyrinomonadaceae bacterium]|nr:P-loop NTPase fold protein [Pyrinomonadaceae bacterium]